MINGPLMLDGDWPRIRPRRLAEATGSDVERAVRQALRAEKNLYAMTNVQIAALKLLLEDARAATVDALSRATKEWQIHDRQNVLASLDAVIGKVNSAASLALEAAQTEAFAAGQNIEPPGISLSALPHIDQGALMVAVKTTPELITNVTQTVKAQIATMIRLAALGQKSPFELMKEMGTVTGKGVWATAFARGEAIYRTEIGRMFSTGTFVRQQALEAYDPGWMKEWHAVHDSRTRPTHVVADGQRVPVDQPFEVGDYKAMYPHDPALPAKESIHCRCISVAIRPDWEKPKPEMSEEQKRAAAADKAKIEFDDAVEALRAELEKLAQTSAREVQGLASKVLEVLEDVDELGALPQLTLDDLKNVLPTLAAQLAAIDAAILVATNPAVLFALRADRAKIVKAIEAIERRIR